MASREDKELKEYRELMVPPDHFEEGFNWKTIVGTVFLGFIMMPGSMYLSLVIGSDTALNTAARWVTIILFAEVARRSLKDLRMQEIYILYYMAGLTIAQPFETLLWRQFLVRSDFSQAMGVAQDIPLWFAPSTEALREAGRTFMTRAWMVPILLSITTMIMHRIENFGLGYFLYRIVNDVEELPFPMAPVAASGITALAQTEDARERWRWRCFSIGGMIGLVFGAVYIAVPVLTSAVLKQSIQIIPVPWVDFTPAAGSVFPAFPFNLTFDLTMIFVGMVIPFWAVVGGFLGVIFTMLLNPYLHKIGILSNWEAGMGFVDTMYINNVDFYLSFSVGLTVAIALISVGQVLKPVWQAMRPARDRASAGPRLRERIQRGWRRFITNNAERGDFSPWVGLFVYLVMASCWLALSVYLIPGFPWYFFVFYIIVYTPLISYATAKLEGLVGQALNIPMVREATFILSGHQGIDIWFAPVPFHNIGLEVVGWRITELTGTRVMSRVKTLLVTLPVVAISALVYSEMLWRIADVPSDAYPFTQKMWELHVKNATLTYSATMEGGSIFMEAWNWDFFSSGLLLGTIAFSVLSMMGLPTLLVFGLVRGLAQSSPGGIVLEMVGALVGRFYFRRRFGNMWMKYAPVLLAGFSCGMGLIAMVAMALTIMSKMMKPLIF